MRQTRSAKHAFARPAGFTAIAALGMTLLLAGCGSDYPLGEEQRKAAESNKSTLQGTLTGGGSSAQNSAMNAWTTAFSSQHPKVQVQYASVGSLSLIHI